MKRAAATLCCALIVFAVPGVAALDQNLPEAAVPPAAAAPPVAGQTFHRAVASAHPLASEEIGRAHV